MRANFRIGFWMRILGPAVLFISRPLFPQCSDTKLLVPDGLRKGQSISILPFGLLGDPSSDEERELQSTFAADLASGLKETALFSEVRVRPDSVASGANLVMEGSITGIKDTPGGITVTVTALIKRTPDGTQVLRMAECATTIKINVDSSFLKRTPGLLESFLTNIAADIVETVAAAARKSATRPK